MSHVFWFSAHFLLLPPVTLSAPIVHTVFRLAQLHGLATFCANHLSLQQVTVLEKLHALLNFHEHKKHLSLFHSHQPGPSATMLRVSFISAAICFHICILHIHNACSYYPCSHPSLFILLIPFHHLILHTAYLHMITGPVCYPTAFWCPGICVLSHTDASPITPTICYICWTCMVSHSTIFATLYK